MSKLFTCCGLSTVLSFSSLFYAPGEAKAQTYRVIQSGCPQTYYQQPNCYYQQPSNCSPTVNVSGQSSMCFVGNSVHSIASASPQNSVQSSPFGFRNEVRMRTVTKYQSETRTRTFTDSNGNQVTQNYTVQVPVTEQVEEVVQVARTQADVIRETDATVAQLSRNIEDIQKKLLKIQKEDDPNKILPTLQTLEELIRGMKANAGN